MYRPVVQFAWVPASRSAEKLNRPSYNCHSGPHASFAVETLMFMQLGQDRNVMCVPGIGL